MELEPPRRAYGNGIGRAEGRGFSRIGTQHLPVWQGEPKRVTLAFIENMGREARYSLCIVKDILRADKDIT